MPNCRVVTRLILYMSSFGRHCLGIWGGSYDDFLTQQAPPDQPIPPLIAESAGSSIHLSWVNPARPNGLLIQGFVLEYLVIEDKETHERGSVEVQDIWRECVRIEVRTRTLPLPPTPCHHGVGSGSGGQRKGTRCFQCQCNLFDFTKRAHGARVDVPTTGTPMRRPCNTGTF